MLKKYVSTIVFGDNVYANLGLCDLYSNCSNNVITYSESTDLLAHLNIENNCLDTIFFFMM